MTCVNDVQANPCFNRDPNLAQPRASFNRIGLMGRPGKSVVVDTLLTIAQDLISRHLTPVFDHETAQLGDFSSLGHLVVFPRAELGQQVDLVIVVGGDGSLLHAARAMAKTNTPVVGVNRGRLGFLTDIHPSEVLTRLGQVLEGNYSLDQRFLLETTIERHGQHMVGDIALNDVVLHAGTSVHMLDFELHIDQFYVYRQHSDGLIISSPTGSTAYALSGGGPIVHPNMDALIVVPMHPHTLSSRPIVVGGACEIKVLIGENPSQPMVSHDGQQGIHLETGDWLHIRKYPFQLTLLHPPGYDFYAACRTKLRWNQDFETNGD